jgi:hypothetical protein
MQQTRYSLASAPVIPLSAVAVAGCGGGGAATASPRPAPWKTMTLTAFGAARFALSPPGNQTSAPVPSSGGNGGHGRLGY